MSMTFLPSQFTLTQTTQQIVSANKGRKHLILVIGNTIALGGDSTLSVDANANVTHGMLSSGIARLDIPSPACEAAIFAAAAVPNEQGATVGILEFVDV